MKIPIIWSVNTVLIVFRVFDPVFTFALLVFAVLTYLVVYR